MSGIRIHRNSLTLSSRISGNSSETTKAELALHNRLLKNNWLAGMSSGEVAGLNVGSPIVVAVSQFPEAGKLADCLLSVAGFEKSHVSDTSEVRSLLVLHGILHNKPQSSEQSGMANLIAIQAVEDALMTAIEVVPLRTTAERARSAHQGAFREALDRSVSMLVKSPDYYHFVDTYYAQAALDDPLAATVSRPGSDVVHELVTSQPEIAAEFAGFRNELNPSSLTLASSAARVVLDAALADAIADGPFAETFGAEAGNRSQRSIRNFVFVTQKHAIGQSLQTSESLAG